LLAKGRQIPALWTALIAVQCLLLPMAAARAQQPSAADRAAVERLVGPLPTAAQVRASHPRGGEYLDKWTRFAQYHWDTYGIGTTDIQVNQYDRVRGFLMLYVVGGDPVWKERAIAVGYSYLRNYLEPNHFAPAPHYSEMYGMALCYLLTGDEAFRSAVGKAADAFVSTYINKPFGDEYALNNTTASSGMDNRIQARTLEALLCAYLIEAPSVGIPAPRYIPGGNDWAVRLREALGKILQTQSADGAFRFMNPTIQNGNNKPWMTTLLLTALTDYHRLFEQDGRIPDVVKRTIDHNWGHDWVPSGPGFMYLDGPADPKINNNGVLPKDLSGFHLHTTSWVYSRTGNAHYADMTDQILVATLDNWYLPSIRNFNQSFSSSPRMWMLRFGNPRNVSVTPTQSTVAPGAAYTLTSTHVNPAGGARIARVYLMISDQNYTNLFRCMYAAQSNRLYVVGADGAWQGGAAPGTATTLSTENGTLYLGGVVVTRPDAQTLQVGWRVSSPSKFTGQTLRVSLYMETDDGKSAGWNALGSVSVTRP
jgi:hypothetical protein